MKKMCVCVDDFYGNDFFEEKEEEKEKEKEKEKENFRTLNIFLKKKKTIKIYKFDQFKNLLCLHMHSNFLKGHLTFWKVISALSQSNSFEICPPISCKSK